MLTKKIIPLSLLLILTACGTTEKEEEQALQPSWEWAAGLTVQSVESSSKLMLSWDAPTLEFDHYELSWQDSMSTQNQEISAELSTFTLTDLKADTPYTVSLKTCKDESCEEFAVSEEPSAKTAVEVWQIEGEGNTYQNALTVVEGGQTLSYALLYGSDAPQGLADTMKFFYNSKGIQDWSPGIRVADLVELDEAMPLEAGIQQSCISSKPGEKLSCPEGALNLYAVQPVPLQSSQTVRLFFEASEGLIPSAPTQLYYLDSQDGYGGEDFNPEKDTEICGGMNSDDLSMGGDCEPTLAIDAGPEAESGLENVRQSKIGYPKLDTWTWDEAPGTFMIITGSDQCGQTVDGLFYATWSGSEWEVEKDEKGCAKPLVDSAHGPVVVHLGEGRYKVYYEAYPEVIEGPKGKSNKHLRVLYGDASLSGDPTVLEFEDWEDQEGAREVQFLWPDESELNEYQESGLGDHFIFLPSQTLEEQVMYMNLGGIDDDTPQEASQGLGMAILVNP